jgi:PhnB protein
VTHQKREEDNDMAKPIPDGFTSVTPHLVIDGCDKALDFYEKAFGAEILARSPGPDGRIWHAEVRIGGSIIMMADEFPEMAKTTRAPTTAGSSSVIVHIYCADTDALFDRAVKAGATVGMPPMDMFWGDRYSQITDPFGHCWAIATHKEDLTPEQRLERGQEAMAAMEAHKAGK